MESSYAIFDVVIKQALRKYWGHPEYEDMYQECYLKILDILSKNPYEPIFNLHGYAFCIARNTISNYMYSYNKKTPKVMFEDFPEIPYVESFDADIILDTVLEEKLEKHKKILPVNCGKDFLLDLITHPDPSSIKLRIVKGDILWTLVSLLEQRS